MPSRSRIRARDRMLPEIDLLIAAHQELRKGKKGPDNQNSILRSSIVLLCAVWEIYCESVIVECNFKLMRAFTDVRKIPESIQKQIVQEVHNENVWKSEPLRLAGNGWKRVTIDLVREKTRSLNTPKSDNLEMLFLQCLGLKGIAKSWACSGHEIDKLVRLRGSIAHQGTMAEKVLPATAKHYRAIISSAISATDDALYDYLKKPELLAKAPWQKTKK
jgi:RiboL-PSP-HEPN